VSQTRFCLVAIFLLFGSAVHAAPSEQKRFESLFKALPGDSTVMVERDGERIAESETIIACADCKSEPAVRLATYRWASVTKQITAVLVMKEVVKDRIKLDAPVSIYLPKFASPNAKRITVRELLRHQTGLPNPDDTPDGAGGIASYYLPGYAGNRDPLTGYCAGPPKGEPGKGWSYNNCDYLVAGALLEQVTGKSWEKLVRQQIAKPLKLRSLHYGGTTDELAQTRNSDPSLDETNIDLGAFGAAGSLSGRPGDLLKFDFALMTGKLLPENAMKEMWDGQAGLGYIALGQWVFEAALAGCSKQVRVVERRGAIGRVQVRNFILPEQKIAAAVFVDQADFDFGEIWQGTGFSYELLTKAACK
jgi:D-alanyl-D-alanine carboxypeptidase